MTSIIKVLWSLKVFLRRGVDGQDGGLSATSIWQAHFRSIFEDVGKTRDGRTSVTVKMGKTRDRTVRDIYVTDP